jgi:integrase/recombinase XerD
VVGEYEIEAISPDDILTFLTAVTEGLKRSTKRYKYTLLKSFFNFIRNNLIPGLVNPCDTPVLRKTFRPSKGRHWTILEKDVVDEIIFRTDNVRNRIMLELMARGGMRIGEVLKLKVRTPTTGSCVSSGQKVGKAQRWCSFRRRWRTG